MNDSNFIYHTMCPSCNSSDACAVYDDGHSYCYSCDTRFRDKLSNTQQDKGKTRMGGLTKPADVFRAIPRRGLVKESIEKYQIDINLNKEIDVAHRYPYFKDGVHVANKVRKRETKDFYWEGSPASAELFGQQLFPPGCAKAITVVEGEIDAPSAYQLQGSKYPVVSVCSAGSAVRDCKRNYEYLNSFSKIVLCFDKDEAKIKPDGTKFYPGQEAAQKVAQMFEPGKVAILTLQHGKDPSDYLQNKIDPRIFIKEWWDAPVQRPDGIKSGSEMWDDIISERSSFSVPYPWKGLQKATYGMRLSEAVLLMADTGLGKALALDTPIPSPAGWTTMGALNKGDIIYDDAGMPCEVTAVTPVQYDRECFRISFDDGTEIIADADHQWELTTKNERSRGKAPRVRTTAQMKTRIDTNSQVGWAIPVTSVQGVTQELPIDPYLLGVWLGDGRTAGGQITSADAFIWDAFNAGGFPVGPYLDKYTRTPYGFQAELQKQGLINNKHVPVQYMLANFSQRLSLLQGLLDSDGYCGEYIEFSSKIEGIARSVLALCRSLGIKAFLKKNSATLYGKDCGYRYRVHFSTRLPVFRLPRKLNKLESLPEPRKTICNRYVTNIESIPSVPVKCIQVDSPSSLYLCSHSYVITHNTKFFHTLELAVLNDPVVIEKGYGVGILHLEEPNRDTALHLMGTHVGKPYHLPDTEKTQDELRKVYDEVINTERLLFYDHFGSNEIDTILNKIRHMAVMGCKYIFVDHLSIIVSDQSGDERRDLDEISTKLKTLTVELDIAVLCIIHTNRSGEARGSAGPEKVANVHLLIERDKEDPDPIRRNITKLTVKKCRLTGRTGPVCWIYYDSNTHQLYELDDDAIEKFEKDLPLTVGDLPWTT